MGQQRRSRSSGNREKLAARCRQVTDACLLLCLFVAPLWFGGRHDLGRFVYATFVAGATLSWAAHCALLNRFTMRPSRLHALWVAALGVVALQLAPLPAAVLHTLSPGLAELAPTWTAGADSPLQLGGWRTLSVDPGATRVGLAVLAAHALLFLVTVERLRDETDVRRLLYAIALASAGMALLGVTQWLTSNGKLLWFYAHPQRAIGEAVQGTFANKNHFAHFVVLGVGAIVLALRAALAKKKRRRSVTSEDRWRRPQQLLWSGALVIALSATILSVSRGAFLALIAAGAVLAAMGLRGSRLGKRHAMGAALFATAALLAVSFGDLHRVAGRLDDLGGGSLELLDPQQARQTIWAANAAALRANPWFGYGVGSHADIYPAFLTEGFATEFTHAESGFFQTTTETGLAGGLLLMAALVTVGGWCGRAALAEADPERRVLWATVSAGLVASVVHSVVDFVWFIPACMTVTILLVACAQRLHQTRVVDEADGGRSTAPTQKASWRPLASAAALALWAVAALWAPGTSSLAWDRYQRASRFERSLASVGALPWRAGSESDDRTIEMLSQQMIAALKETIDRNPRHAQAHLRLAGRLIQRFERNQIHSPNSMPLKDIRAAALAAEFPSRAATREWLGRATGDGAADLAAAHRHTRIALSLKPLQGDGYAYLAYLCFLSPPDERDIAAYIDQALTIRPCDGAALLEAAKQALFIDDWPRAIELWKRAHAVPGWHRPALLAQVTAAYSADQYIAEFQPDWQSLSLAHKLYRHYGRSDGLGAVAEHAVTLSEEPITDRWSAIRSQAALRLASEVFEDLQRPGKAVECAERSVQLGAADYSARRRLACAYAAADRLEDAAPHARWCLARRPMDKQLQRWLKQLEKDRLAAATLSPAARR